MKRDRRRRRRETDRDGSRAASLNIPLKCSGSGGAFLPLLTRKQVFRVSKLIYVIQPSRQQLRVSNMLTAPSAGFFKCLNPRMNGCSGLLPEVGAAASPSTGSSSGGSGVKGILVNQIRWDKGFLIPNKQQSVNSRIAEDFRRKQPTRRGVVGESAVFHQQRLANSRLPECLRHSRSRRRPGRCATHWTVFHSSFPTCSFGQPGNKILVGARWRAAARRGVRRFLTSVRRNAGAPF